MSRAALLLALLALLALPGCLYVGARGRVGPQLDPALAERLEPGRSTMGDALALLGPPEEFLMPEETALLLDERLRLSQALDVARRAERAFTWQLDRFALDGTWLLLFAWFDIDTESELLVVWFDEQGVVTHVASTAWASASGSAGADA